MQNIYLLVAVGLFVTVAVSTAAYAYRWSSSSAQLSWDDLLARLVWIDHSNIAQVAQDFAVETRKPLRPDDATMIEPSHLWTLIGGLEGLERLEANSDVLIDMAAYLQQWYPEAVVIAERLRLDGRELKWHVNRLRGAAKNGNLRISFPFYAQRAVVTYYLMTQRVLALYQAGDFSRLANPQGAL